MSKRKRREEEEAEARRLRAAAQAHLKKSNGYVGSDSFSANSLLQKGSVGRDNTIEVIKKRKERQTQSGQDGVDDVGKSNVMQNKMVRKTGMQSIIKKVGQNTLFGIPLASSESLPENWVLVQSHIDENVFYFWNTKDNSTSWKIPRAENSIDKTEKTTMPSQDEDNDEPIYSTFDAQTQQEYFWRTDSWIVKDQLAKLLGTKKKYTHAKCIAPCLLIA